MRIVLLGAVVVLLSCGGHHTSAPACTLRPAPTPSPETGEHSVALTSSCALAAIPRVELYGLHGARLPFTYVLEGGARRSHSLLLDKYRCDVRYRDLAHTVVVAGARLDIGRSLLDWCPAEAVSTVVHVYLGPLRRTKPTQRDVYRDVSDDRLDRVWPCAALRAAIAHQQLARATARVCDAQVAEIARGAPRFAVEDGLGPPSSGGPRCPVWRWDPAGGSIDGARICFTNGRATLIQRAVHG